MLVGGVTPKSSPRPLGLASVGDLVVSQSRPGLVEQASASQVCGSARKTIGSSVDLWFDHKDSSHKKKFKSKKHKKSRKGNNRRGCSSKSSSSSCESRDSKRRKQRNASEDVWSAVSSAVFCGASTDPEGKVWAALDARYGVEEGWAPRQTQVCTQVYFNWVIAGDGAGSFLPSQKRDCREAQALCLMLDLFANGRGVSDRALLTCPSGRASFLLL